MAEDRVQDPVPPPPGANIIEPKWRYAPNPNPDGETMSYRSGSSQIGGVEYLDLSPRLSASTRPASSSPLPYYQTWNSVRLQKCLPKRGDEGGLYPPFGKFRCGRGTYTNLGHPHSRITGRSVPSENTRWNSAHSPLPAQMTSQTHHPPRNKQPKRNPDWRKGTKVNGWEKR